MLVRGEGYPEFHGALSSRPVRSAASCTFEHLARASCIGSSDTISPASLCRCAAWSMLLPFLDACLQGANRATALWLLPRLLEWLVPAAQRNEKEARRA